jgi:hypothetical protein
MLDLPPGLFQVGNRGQLGLVDRVAAGGKLFDDGGIDPSGAPGSRQPPPAKRRTTGVSRPATRPSAPARQAHGSHRRPSGAPPA